MVVGVSEGYKIELELVGVGFRASNSGQVLEMALGFSHPVVFLIPAEVKVTTEMKKGSPPLVILESNDKQLIGQVAARSVLFVSQSHIKAKVFASAKSYDVRKVKLLLNNRLWHRLKFQRKRICLDFVEKLKARLNA